MTGECFTLAFQKATTPPTPNRKLTESLTKSHERITCLLSTTEIVEQDMKYVQK